VLSAYRYYSIIEQNLIDEFVMMRHKELPVEVTDILYIIKVIQVYGKVLNPSLYLSNIYSVNDHIFDSQYTTYSFSNLR